MEACWSRQLESGGLQAERLATLNEISRVVSSSLHLHTLYDTIYEQVGRVMDTSQFFIALYRQGEDSIEVPYLREDGCLRADQYMTYGTNVTSLVIERGAPLLFDADDEYRRYAAENGLPPNLLVGDKISEAKIFVPLNTGHRTIGAMSAQSNRSCAYTTEDVQTLSVIAAQAAIAIENARLFSEQQRRVVELQTIQSIVQNLMPLHDINEIAELIEREVRHLIDYHSCRLFVLDAYRQMLVLISPEAPGMEVRLGEGITGWIAAHNQSVLVPNTLQDGRVNQIAGTPRREESLIGASLVYEGRVQGVITLSKLGVRQFDDNDLRLLEIIAAQTAIAFDRARLHDELRREAITDELTKLYNRRYLRGRFREEQARALRNGHPLAAMILDIDKFKRVNDRYGHDAGDVVLRDLATVIRTVVRAEDIVARHGGEEFCVLMPDTAPHEAGQAAERLRAAVERHQLPREAGVSSITVSIGLALVSTEDGDMEVFTRADLAMYEVKHVGGNRICLCDAGDFHFYPEGSRPALVP